MALISTIFIIFSQIKTQISISKMDQLRNFTMADLHEKLRMEDNDFEAWLEELGLLHAKRTCSECGGRTTIHVSRGQRYGNWRCTTKACRKEIGYLRGTFFEGTHLTPKQIFQLSYLWAHQLGTYDERHFQTGIEREAMTDWTNFFHDVCAQYFVENPVEIGGNGMKRGKRN